MLKDTLNEDLKKAMLDKDMVAKAAPAGKRRSRERSRN